jgi:hypothetical protein
MSNDERILLCAIALFGVTILSAAHAPAAPAGAEGNSCVRCHSALPGSSFVGARSHSWSGSVHQKHGVTCDKCHGGDPQAADEQRAHAGVLGSRDPKSTVYYKTIPSTCGKCHGAEFFKFSQSLHYRRLQATGRGPECVTCHGSMVTSILTPDTIAVVCEQCHNERMGVLPYIPQKAKAVLLLLKESAALLDAKEKLSRSVGGAPGADVLREARSSLTSARLDWHRFDLDTITVHLQKLYDLLETPPAPAKRR